MALAPGACLIRFGLVALVSYFITPSMLSLLNAEFVVNGGAGAVAFFAIVGPTLGAAYVAMGSPALPRAARNAPTA